MSTELKNTIFYHT